MPSDNSYCFKKESYLKIFPRIVTCYGISCFHLNSRFPAFFIDWRDVFFLSWSSTYHDLSSPFKMRESDSDIWEAEHQEIFQLEILFCARHFWFVNIFVLFNSINWSLQNFHSLYWFGYDLKNLTFLYGMQKVT